MPKSITAHCLVRNEARFVWYSVMSVYEHVDKILLWDTGSADRTPEVIKKIQDADVEKKINFKLFGEINAQGFTKARQEMLDGTETDWFIVVDGDEIWWEDSIRKVIEKIQKDGDRMESIVVPTINLVGDIFHYQEEAAGRYELAGRHGHLNLRAINRKIPGLRSHGPHGVWGWVDEKGRMIQDRGAKKVVFVNAPYLHATHLPRASKKEIEAEVPKRSSKLKFELGTPFPKDFYYPEVFFRAKPAIVTSPWITMNAQFKLRACLETPLKKLKRRVIQVRVGY